MKGKYKRIIKNSRKTTKLRQKSEPTQGEAKVIKFLMENNIEFIREFFHRTLYNPATNRLFYFMDYYVIYETTPHKFVVDVEDEIGETPTHRIHNLDEALKLEHFLDIMSKYTLSQVQNLLP